MMQLTAGQNFKKQLLAISSADSILVDEDLKKHTYIQLGGKADYFITPTSYRELEELVRFCALSHLPITILGKGSKLIIQDGGIRGVVLSLKNLKSVQVENDRITAQAGADIMTVSEIALSHQLSGLEFACGIPGSVGGTVFMNAGAYDGEIKDVLESCLIIDCQGNILEKSKADLDFSYRYSNLRITRDIVLEARFRLKKGESELIRAKMDKFTEQRQLHQPLEYPSCGSVFKRPVGHYAGKLIQDCHLQGVRIGGAEVSKKHAGFIVNIGGATADDYIALIDYVQKAVKEQSGIDLIREVEIIGEP